MREFNGHQLERLLEAFVSFDRLVKAACCLMTYKYGGSIVVLSISKIVKPNEKQKELTSDFRQGFTTSVVR